MIVIIDSIFMFITLFRWFASITIHCSRLFFFLSQSFGSCSHFYLWKRYAESISDGGHKVCGNILCSFIFQWFRLAHRYIIVSRFSSATFRILWLNRVIIGGRSDDVFFCLFFSHLVFLFFFVFFLSHILLHSWRSNLLFLFCSFIISRLNKIVISNLFHF